MELRNGYEITREGTGTAVQAVAKKVDLSNAEGFTIFLKNTGDTNALAYELRLYPNAGGSTYKTWGSGSIAVGAFEEIIEVKDIAYSKAVLLVSGVTDYKVEGFVLKNMGA